MARALALSPAEYEHLCILAGHAIAQPGQVNNAVAFLLQSICNCPFLLREFSAGVMDSGCEILTKRTVLEGWVTHTAGRSLMGCHRSRW